jgi:hypothetical protein
MKKILVISSFFLVLIIASTIGYKVVSANTKIDEVDDIITYQESQEEYLTHYNYTLDNPNIVLNPYGISPLTALIIFETKDEEEVTITITGHDKNSTYTNKFQKTKEHYIPVFGLYPDYNNEIIIKCGDITKKYNIKTEKLPEDFQKETKENNTNNLYFITTNKYPYAIDNNNEVRWYLTDNYSGKISRLENGNLLLSSNELIDKTHYKGLLELDLLGKVYHEYDNYDGYYGSYAETKETILVLSKNIIEIDKQNGEIIRTIKLNNQYSSISYDNNNIILKNNNEILTIDYKKETTKTYQNNKLDNEQEILLPLYNQDHYELSKGVKFTNNKETKQSNKNIILLNYKKIDSNYQSHNIKITKESDRLIISANIDKTEESYIILDKFLDKKVYNLKSGYNYINNENLSGDYSIYIKINDIIYKTNKYVTF